MKHLNNNKKTIHLKQKTHSKLLSKD